MPGGLGGALSVTRWFVQSWASPWRLAWPLAVLGGPEHALQNTHGGAGISPAAGSHRSSPGLGISGGRESVRSLAPSLAQGWVQEVLVNAPLEAQRGTTTGPRPHSEAGLIPPVSSCCSSRGNQGGGLGTWFCWSQPLPGVTDSCSILLVLQTQQARLPGPAGRGAQEASCPSDLPPFFPACLQGTGIGCSLLSPESQS